MRPRKGNLRQRLPTPRGGRIAHTKGSLSTLRIGPVGDPQITAPIGTEGVGFEPTVGCPTKVFKTFTLNHSDTPPGGKDRIRRGGRPPRPPRPRLGGGAGVQPAT